MPIDYFAYPVLFVDDEQQNLVVFRYAFQERFTVLTASSGEEAVDILQKNDIAVLIADQRMPGMTGVDLCSRARKLRPNALRILVTAYADLHAAIDAINKGQVLRYITKPWNNEEVAEIIRTCIDLYSLQRSVEDMEIRLLRGGQTTTAVAIHQELAHEINNPLASLNVNAQLVGDLINSATKSLTDADRVRELLDSALETHSDSLAAINQLVSLMIRLRQGYRPSAATPVCTCDAARVVDSTVRIVRREIERVARLQVVLEASPVVPIDASALGQIVLNLLLNAAQAIENADKASAETNGKGAGANRDGAQENGAGAQENGAGAQEKKGNVITVKLSEERNEVRLQVTDTGPGIPQEHINRVFDPYFTTKNDSTGIGLAIVSELAKQAGGNITVRSAPGRGATFTLTLPLLTM